MKQLFLSALLASLTIGTFVSCSNESDVQTNDKQELNIDASVSFNLKSGNVTIKKPDGLALTTIINDFIDDSKDQMDKDPNIGEIHINITETPDTYIFSPFSTEPVYSLLLGKCPEGTSEVLACNGLSDDCKQSVEAAVKKAFSGLGRGSDVTVNVKVNALGFTRVSVGGEK